MRASENRERKPLKHGNTTLYAAYGRIVTWGGVRPAMICQTRRPICIALSSVYFACCLRCSRCSRPSGPKSLNPCTFGTGAGCPENSQRQCLSLLHAHILYSVFFILFCVLCSLATGARFALRPLARRVLAPTVSRFWWWSRWRSAEELAKFLLFFPVCHLQSKYRPPGEHHDSKSQTPVFRCRMQLFIAPDPICYPYHLDKMAGEKGAPHTLRTRRRGSACVQAFAR